MVDNRSMLTLAAFFSLALNGLVLTSMGTSLPLIQAYLGIDINQAGMLIAILQAGITIFSLIAGILTDHLRSDRILLSGCLLLGAASFAFCATTNYIANLPLVFVMGAGIGCILSGSNTLLINLYPVRKGRILNIHHIFFGLGSLAGPLLMGYLIVHGNLWREGFTAQAILLCLLATTFFYGGREKIQSQKKIQFFPQVQKLIKDRHFLVILLMNGLSMGTQVTILMLGVTYLIEEKMFTLPVASIALAAFSLCIMFGRLICSRLIMTLPHTTIILALLWLQLFMLSLSWYFHGWTAIVALAVSGLSFSGIYPTSLALTGALFPKVAGSALGILTTVGGLCCMLLSWLTAYTASLTDLGTGFIILILACLAALAVFQISYSALCQRELELSAG